MNKETLKVLSKDFADLSKPVATQKLAPKLQKHVKIIYYVLSGFLAFGAIRAFISIFTGNISLAILDLLLTFVYFMIVRMFGELLVMAKLPETTEAPAEEKTAEKTEEKAEEKTEEKAE